LANYSATSIEVTGFTDYVEAMFGAPVVNVELSANQYTHAFNNSIQEYSNYINQWAIRNNIAGAFGLPSATDFTQRWVAKNFEFAKSFSEAYSEQANVGGTVPIYKSAFTLSNGTQAYGLPDDININEVMWQEPAAITRYLADPNNNPAWVNFEFGWGYMGYSYQYIVPVYYSIQLAQATEMRWKIYKGDYTYKIFPGQADATRAGYTGKTRNVVHIYPIPQESQDGINVWYFYKRIDELNLYSAQSAGEYVNNPGTIRVDEIPYSAFNSTSQRWVKQFAFATCKEILGRIRNKFSTLPIPDAEVTLDGERLLTEGQEEKRELKEYLLNELQELSTRKLLEEDAMAAENINKTLAFTPNKIYLF